MYKNKVVDHFGTQSAVAKALKIARSCVCGWGDVIPEKHALKLERLTVKDPKGQLTYDESLYQKDTAVVAA